jgi:hypothetical protein
LLLSLIVMRNLNVFRETLHIVVAPQGNGSFNAVHTKT